MVIFRIILTIAFVFVGGAKLVQAKPLKDQFSEFGLPGFFLLLVGAFEVLGGIGLQFPALTASAAAGLLILVVLAMYNHYKVKHPLQSYIPALVLGSAPTVYLALWLKLNPF